MTMARESRSNVTTVGNQNIGRDQKGGTTSNVADAGVL